MFKLCAQKLIGSPPRVSKFIELVCLALVVALQVEQVALSIQQVLHEFTVLVFALDALEAAARKVCRILNVNYIGVLFVLKHLVLAGKLVISKLVAVFFVLVGSILQELVARAAIKVVGLSTLHIVVTLARHVERLLLAVRFELDASHAGHASRQIKVLLAKAPILTLLNLNIKVVHRRRVNNHTVIGLVIFVAKAAELVAAVVLLFVEPVVFEGLVVVGLLVGGCAGAVLVEGGGVFLVHRYFLALQYAFDELAHLFLRDHLRVQVILVLFEQLAHHVVDWNVAVEQRLQCNLVNLLDLGLVEQGVLETQLRGV